jgi:hypothetical protein
MMGTVLAYITFGGSMYGAVYLLLSLAALALTRRVPGLKLFDIKSAWFNEEEYLEFFPRTLFEGCRKLAPHLAPPRSLRASAKEVPTNLRMSSKYLISLVPPRGLEPRTPRSTIW